MDWLSRSERRFGRLGIPNLIIYIVAGRALAYILSRTNPGFPDYLALDPDAVMRGEAWRLLTYLFMPPPYVFVPLSVAGTPAGGIVIALLHLYFTFLLGHAVEEIWGSFRFTIYYLLGAVATAVVSFTLVRAPATPVYLDLSLLLAFSTLAPEFTIVVYVIPVKVNWFAWLSVLGQVVIFAKSNLPGKLAIFVALSNYFLFFRPKILAWAAVVTGTRWIGSHFRRRRPVHRCSVCGVTELRDPDQEFRICACQRCGEGREFCMAHLREHRKADERA